MAITSLRSRRKRVAHAIGWFAIAVTGLTVTAAPASADRAYSAVEPNGLGDMFVLRISDDRSTLRFASVHMEVLCGGRVAEEMGTTFTIARRAPTARQLKSKDFLQAGRIRGGAVTARVHYSREYLDGVQWLRGTLSLRRIRERTLRASWTIRSTWDPKQGPSRSCVFRRTFAMHRNPGVIFVGGTSDLEPVEIVRESAGTGAGVSVGYWAECRDCLEPMGAAALRRPGRSRWHLRRRRPGLDARPPGVVGHL